MAISRQDVEHVATLARLELTDEEVATFGEQLGRILAHAARVTALDTEGVPPTSHPLPLSNVFRPDVVGAPAPCLSQKEALANAPLAEAGHFRVPRILEAEA